MGYCINLIGNALDIWWKTKLAPYLEGINIKFQRKATDINAVRFHGKKNWAVGLSK